MIVVSIFKGKPRKFHDSEVKGRKSSMREAPINLLDCKINKLKCLYDFIQQPARYTCEWGHPWSSRHKPISPLTTTVLSRPTVITWVLSDQKSQPINSQLWAEWLMFKLLNSAVLFKPTGSRIISRNRRVENKRTLQCWSRIAGLVWKLMVRERACVQEHKKERPGYREVCVESAYTQVFPSSLH